MKSGQVLIIVLLVIVVVLALGLSVASRNITNLRTATQTEQSQRAFSAAEGGVESALSKLSSGLVVSDSGESYTLGELGVTNDVSGTVNIKGSRVYGGPIILGNVAQIDLNGFDGNNDIRILWAKSNEKDGSGPASLEITQVYGAGTISQERYFAKGGGSRVGESVVSNPAVLSDCGGFSPGEFLKCIQIKSKPNATILRIKPFWVDTSVKVASTDPSSPLPVQTYDVVSTATTDIGVTRKVQVTKTALPQLPAVFDYVLFSEGSVIK